jgi:hypothetical protein
MVLDAEQAAAAIVGGGAKFGWRADGAIEVAVNGGIYAAAPPGRTTADSFEHACRLRKRVELSVQRALEGFAAEQGLNK